MGSNVANARLESWFFSLAELWRIVGPYPHRIYCTRTAALLLWQSTAMADTFFHIRDDFN